MSSTSQAVSSLRGTIRLRLLIGSTALLIISAFLAFLIGPALLMLGGIGMSGATGDIMRVGFLGTGLSAALWLTSAGLVVVGFITARTSPAS